MPGSRVDVVIDYEVSLPLLPRIFDRGARDGPGQQPAPRGGRPVPRRCAMKPASGGRPALSAGCVPCARRGDEGQLLLLVLVYTVIAGLAGHRRREPVARPTSTAARSSAAADGAALTAANQPDLERVYTGAGQVLPLSETGARAAVRQYAVDADLDRRFDGFRVVDVSTDGQTVTVALRAVVEMPFANVLTAGIADGYEVGATARATSPLSP